MDGLYWACQGFIPREHRVYTHRVDVILGCDAVRRERVDSLCRAEPGGLHTGYDLVDRILRQRDQTIGHHKEGSEGGECLSQLLDHGMASTGAVDSPYQHQLNGQNLSTNNRSRLIPCKLTCVNVCSAYPRNAFLIGDLSQTKGDGFRHLVRSQVVPVAARLGLYSVVKTAVYTRVSSTAVCKTIVVSEKSSFRPASLPTPTPPQEVRHNPCRGILGARLMAR